jgi:hypothetical protein
MDKRTRNLEGLNGIIGGWLPLKKFEIETELYGPLINKLKRRDIYQNFKGQY